MSSQSIRTLPVLPVAVSNNSSSFTPSCSSVVYNFSNCTVHHVGSSIPNSSSSSDE
jgi:hypothetical protein